jgi:hypothetical protein
VRRFAPQLFAQLFCIPLMLVLFSNADGQFTVERHASQEQVQNLELLVSNARRNINLDSRQNQQIQRSVGDDFRKLQMVNNGLMTRMFVRSSFATQEITQKEVRSSLSEIKKIAKRLRFDLAIPEVKASETSYNVTLSPGLLLLDKAVMSFVENPLFSQPRVIDAELASRAEKDLNEILLLSDFLRKLTKED